MFQYNDAGDIQEIYFIDFQCPKYGSPAIDLIYFIISSTAIDIKISKFDYFLKLYHDYLIESLTILNYVRKFPTLRDIHQYCLNAGTWAYAICQSLMPCVLMDPRKDVTLENLFGDTEVSNSLKRELYLNKRYCQHVKVVFPWLLNRGALAYIQ